MPLDVIMPALGMAQDTGLIVAWHKQSGDAVSKGDILFEVETDKATMEVEAQGDGFLTDVSAQAGAEVPVGNVIARISDSAEKTSPGTETGAVQTAVDALPEGKAVIMPTLGMAQDTGLLVTWHKAPGDPVAVDDVLFEVETDKSTMEVVADVAGFVAALLAEAGEEVPVGQTIAIISAMAPTNPISRSAASDATAATTGSKATSDPAPATTQKAPAKTPKPLNARPSARADGRILASPKLKRLAREHGLDLTRLVDAGYPQPFHVKDLETLKSLAVQTTAPAPQVAALGEYRLTANLPTEGFTEFAAWAAEHANLTDRAALMAGLCANGGETSKIVAVETFGHTKTYTASAKLGATEPCDQAAQLRIRDLRFTPIHTVQVGAEDTPVLTLTGHGAGLTITLEYAGDQLSANDAITLLSNFAGRVEQPLRHLL
jgi:pyruvate/2-oxoglutarate dehydrogenase complex dihydrolipoamide acyltransferase (E2) component